MNEDIIENKVAESGLLELNLEDYYPREEIIVFDLKAFLFMELILKEKDFREALKKLNFETYRDKLVAVTCTADAIIPVWAYMLVASYLQPVVKEMVMGDAVYMHQTMFIKNIRSINIEQYQNKRLVIKGCGDLETGPFAYFEITRLLRPVARSIMYGEPCSTVPVFKTSITG